MTHLYKEEDQTYGSILPVEKEANSCNDSCSLVLVESIPSDIIFGGNSTNHRSVYQAWLDLLNTASTNVNVASYYWSMTGEDIHVKDPSSKLGENILKEFEGLSSRNVPLFIATSFPSLAKYSKDLKNLKKKGAHIRTVNCSRLTKGVLHSKFWIVDMKHVYIGSANMDWRSLTQVKELGAMIYNCSCLATDLWKIFNAYWYLGGYNATIPVPWPVTYSTTFNQETPLELTLNGNLARVYFSSSPPVFCPKGRTDDLSAIVSIIDDAEKFVCVSVMDYFPTTRFSRTRKYWPAIDNALRRAVFERSVKVQLLVSCWSHTDPSMFLYLQSLYALNDPKANISLEVKIFIIPAVNHTSIPFSRVNHNKYMVTDKVAYIGTSNWSADYFSRTAGVGLIINETSEDNHGKGQTVQGQLTAVFERDWNSKYAVNIEYSEHHQECTLGAR
nr:PREDICTED: phospholipase D4 [Latimeria chalumnae]|eukprot:XP_014340673.1 PREDICTED: phospholipase D4 [Latimeria chalumnae]